jgi:hypothetical protein
MPPEDGGRLDEKRDAPPRGRDAGGDSHDQAGPRRPSDAANDLTLRDDELLPKYGVLRQEGCARSEVIGETTTEESQQVKHEAS